VPRIGLCWSSPVALLADVLTASDVFTASDTFAAALSWRLKATTPFRRDTAESLSFLALPIGRHNLTAYGQAGDASHKCSVPPTKPPDHPTHPLAFTQKLPAYRPKRRLWRKLRSRGLRCTVVRNPPCRRDNILWRPCKPWPVQGLSGRAVCPKRNESVFGNLRALYIRIPHQIVAGYSLFLANESRSAGLSTLIEQHQRKTCVGIIIFFLLPVKPSPSSLLASSTESIVTYSPHATVWSA